MRAVSIKTNQTHYTARVSTRAPATQHRSFSSVEACVDALRCVGDAAEAIGTRLVSWCSSGLLLYELTPVFGCWTFTNKDLLLVYNMRCRVHKAMLRSSGFWTPPAVCTALLPTVLVYFGAPFSALPLGKGTASRLPINQKLINSRLDAETLCMRLVARLEIDRRAPTEPPVNSARAVLSAILHRIITILQTSLAHENLFIITCTVPVFLTD